MHASKTQHAERSEDLIVGETPCAAPLHLVPLAKERTSAIIDVVVDRPIGRHSRAVAEIGRPAEQKPVQPVAHLGPWFLVADTRMSPTFVLIRCTLFLDGLAPKYHFPFALYQCGPNE